MAVVAIEDRTDVIVYASGIAVCSACAPKSMSREDVEAQVNAKLPTGLNHGWSISDQPTFKGGEPNPCQCEDVDARQHFLLEC